MLNDGTIEREMDMLAENHLRKEVKRLRTLVSEQARQIADLEAALETCRADRLSERADALLEAVLS